MNDKQNNMETLLYSDLQKVLFAYNLPETENCFAAPKQCKTERDRLTVVLLGPPAECIALALEGGRQSPGDVLLVLSANWLTQKSGGCFVVEGSTGPAAQFPSSECLNNGEIGNYREQGNEKSCNGPRELFVSMAVSFEADGKTCLESYKPPRRVNLLVNFFEREQKNLPVVNCPIKNITKKGRKVDEILATRSILAGLGASVPATLAFSFSSLRLTDGGTAGEKSASSWVVILDRKSQYEDVIKREIETFSSLLSFKTKQIVARFYKTVHEDCHEILLNGPYDVVDMTTSIVKSLANADDSASVLIEEKICDIMDDRVPEKVTLKWGADRSMISYATSIVCEGEDGLARMTQLISYVCSAKQKKEYIQPQTLQSTLMALGVKSSDVYHKLYSCIRCCSEKLHQALFSERSERKPNEIDILSVDFMLVKREGELEAVAIKARSNVCMKMCFMYECLNPSLRGQALCPLSGSLISQAQLSLMRGKTVLVVGAGFFSKMFIWPASKEYGIKIILVEQNREHEAQHQVDKFIHYDMADHTQDESHARNIINILRAQKILLDGCVAFWEDCGPLAAYINEALGLGGAGVRGAVTAKNKSSTQQAVRDAGNTSGSCQADVFTDGLHLISNVTKLNGFNRTTWSHPVSLTNGSDGGHLVQLKNKMLNSLSSSLTSWDSSVSSYASKAFHIGCDEELESAVSQMDFPAVLKLEYGAGAVGVTLVADGEECRKQWATVQADLPDENSRPGIGLGHGNSMLLMDYLGGTEHDVDVILYKRQLLAAFVSDNGPTRVPRFTETAGIMPTCLPDDKKHQLIVAAHRCCIQIGLVTGVFNVELKMTGTGPKLLEINARMAGFYLRHWINVLYGVDILFCSFALACGVRPVLPVDSRFLPSSSFNSSVQGSPLPYLVGIMTVPSMHREALTDSQNLALLHRLEEEGTILVNRLEKEMPSEDRDKYEEPFLNIAVMDQDLEVAKQKLLDVCDKLHLNSEKYPVKIFLEDFT